jgi:hypothetical protein
MRWFKRFWSFLVIENNRAVLTLMGAALAAVVVALWTIFIYSETKSRLIISSNARDMPPAPDLRPDSDRANPLAEDQVRWAIGKALEGSDLAKAVVLLSNLTSPEVKIEECQHVYDYAMKNRELELAKKIVPLCWNGEARRERLTEIEHERLKQ